MASLFDHLLATLQLQDPAAKCSATHTLYQDFAAMTESPDHDAAPPISLIDAGHPARPVLVHPAKVPRRRLGSLAGRQALLHAIAHIEFTAINLALDACYRFRHMPDAYYQDWLRVAADEARHFCMLQQRLHELDSHYGALPAHNGLWSMAYRTEHDVLHRMALVPRLLEARGLDVTPGLIQRLEKVDDEHSAALLRIILQEEITHVRIGNHWYLWCCRQRNKEPSACFLDLLQRYQHTLALPLNIRDRLAAGFTEQELAILAQPR